MTFYAFIRAIAFLRTLWEPTIVPKLNRYRSSRDSLRKSSRPLIGGTPFCWRMYITGTRTLRFSRSLTKWRIHFVEFTWKDIFSETQPEIVLEHRDHSGRWSWAELQDRILSSEITYRTLREPTHPNRNKIAPKASELIMQSPKCSEMILYHWFWAGFLLECGETGI